MIQEAQKSEALLTCCIWDHLVHGLTNKKKPSKLAMNKVFSKVVITSYLSLTAHTSAIAPVVGLESIKWCNKKLFWQGGVFMCDGEGNDLCFYCCFCIIFIPCHMRMYRSAACLRQMLFGGQNLSTLYRSFLSVSGSFHKVHFQEWK